MSSSLSASSSQGGTNATTNQSTVYVSATVTITAGYFQGYQSYGYITIGGVTQPIAGPTYMAALSDPHVAPESWSFSWSRTFDHDANGYRGDVGCSASFAVDGLGYHSSSAGAATQGAIDYDRRPSQPAWCANTLEANKTLTASWNAVSSLAGTPTYYVQYASAVGGGGYGSWSGEYATTGTSYNFSLARAATHKFRVRAANSDGGTGYTESAGVYVPAGGKVFENGSWRLNNFVRKFDGTNWNDTQLAKIHNGSGFVDIQ